MDLLEAGRKCDPGLAKAALAAGANPKFRDKDGASVWSEVLIRRSVPQCAQELPVVLAMAGVDLAYRDEEGDNLVLSLIGNPLNDVKLLRILVEKGVNINERNKNTGYTALMLADRKEKMQYLLEKGQDVNAVEKQGRSGLMLAAMNAMDCQRVLDYVAVGSDISLKDKSGKTAADIFHESFIKLKRQAKNPHPEDSDVDYGQIIRQAEKCLIALPLTEKLGKVVGRVFKVGENKVEITGPGISKLLTGQKLIIKNGRDKSIAVVTETLHSKVKARISGGKKVSEGDPVYLAE